MGGRSQQNLRYLPKRENERRLVAKALEIVISLIYTVCSLISPKMLWKGRSYLLTLVPFAPQPWSGPRHLLWRFTTLLVVTMNLRWNCHLSQVSIPMEMSEFYCLLKRHFLVYVLKMCAPAWVYETGKKRISFFMSINIYWLPTFIKDEEVTETGKSVLAHEPSCQQHGMVEGFKFHCENNKK